MRLTGVLAAALFSASLFAQEDGARLYAAQCSYCHGPTGDGGRGANLAVPKLRHANDEAALAQLIRQGIPGTEMPRFSLTADQLTALARFVLSLGRAKTEAVPGDSARGAQLYAKHDCAQCHTIRGRGGAMGPDLTGIGERTGPAYLRRSLTDPQADLPPGFLQLRLTGPEGDPFTAVLLDEDSFSIRVRDSHDRVRSYLLTELRAIDRQKGRSPMPSYARLATRDLDDIVAFLASPNAPAVTPIRRAAAAGPEPGDWPSYHGTDDGQRYSRLNQIRTDNVAQLKLAWMYQLRTTHKVETTPLVLDGIMYITEPPSSVTALDLKTGRPIWKYQRQNKPVAVCCGEVNRGVAVWKDLVFLGTIDSHLIALDRATGRVRWDVEVADPALAYSITAAPQIVKDKVIVGIAGAEYGVRGFLDAYHASTGERAWRFWTVPAPPEPGSETWSGDSWKTGGATTWMTGTYDPAANLIYWGTGNPAPDYIGDVRKGDNLYSDSVIALDPDTGKLKWHFQFIPHDVNDMDANQVPVLLDADYGGRPRKLMLFANRGGFYYLLDRITGEFLSATQFARQNWALRIDERGRPVPNPKTVPNLEGALVYPDDDGAANWHSPSYSPRTGLFYQNVRERGAIYFRTQATFEPGKFYLGAARRPIPGEPGTGALRAWDALTGEQRWEFPYATPPWSGILTTAGGLVFSSTMEGDFFALDDKTGKLSWRIQTGAPVWAAPMTYMHNEKQYIAIATGSAILVFTGGAGFSLQPDFSASPRGGS